MLSIKNIPLLKIYIMQMADFKTVRLDNDVHRAAKIEAAKTGKSLQETINLLIKEGLQSRKK